MREADRKGGSDTVHLVPYHPAVPFIASLLHLMLAGNKKLLDSPHEHAMFLFCLRKDVLIQKDKNIIHAHGRIVKLPPLILPRFPQTAFS